MAFSNSRKKLCLSSHLQPSTSILFSVLKTLSCIQDFKESMSTRDTVQCLTEYMFLCVNQDRKGYWQWWGRSLSVRLLYCMAKAPVTPEKMSYLG